MRQRVKSTFVGVGLGLAVSLLMLAFMAVVDSCFHDHTVPAYGVVARAFEIMNAPSFWLAHYWSYELHLPPYHEAAWLMFVPMIFVQWCVIGLLVGLSWRWKKRQGTQGNQE